MLQTIAWGHATAGARPGSPKRKNPEMDSTSGSAPFSLKDVISKRRKPVQRPYYRTVELRVWNEFYLSPCSGTWPGSDPDALRTSFTDHAGPEVQWRAGPWVPGGQIERHCATPSRKQPHAPGQVLPIGRPAAAAGRALQKPIIGTPSVGSHKTIN